MLPKNRRISRRFFKAILETGRTVHSANFMLRVAPSEKESRLAVSVSKKVSKKAVERNTLRRRIYAILRGIMNRMKPGLYLIVVKPSARQSKGKKLEDEIRSLIVSCLS